MRGAFLVLEGPEGAGKSTQAARLVARLRDSGREVLATREPGGTPAASRIRDVILDPELRIDPLPEFLLYAAARAQHVRETIRPALDADRVVVCDRFAASSLAYQGHGRGLDPAFVRALNERATEGLGRVAARGATDRLERADAAFHERVRRGFLAEAEREGDWLVLDALADEDALAAAVWQRVAPLLPAPRARRA